MPSKGPKPILKHSTHPHDLALFSATKGLHRSEEDHTRWRAHIKFNKWDVWEAIYAPNLKTARVYLKERMEAKGRGTVPIASIVRADPLFDLLDGAGDVIPDMSLQDQILMDAKKPDGVEVYLAEMTDDEREQMLQTRRDNDQRAANELLKKIEARGSEKEVVERARKKRLEQMKNDPGGNKDRATWEISQGVQPYNLPAEKFDSDGKLINPHKSQHHDS